MHIDSSYRYIKDLLKDAEHYDGELKGFCAKKGATLLVFFRGVMWGLSAPTPPRILIQGMVEDDRQERALDEPENSSEDLQGNDEVFVVVGKQSALNGSKRVADCHHPKVMAPIP
jgi:hypothetical protein